jgi:hypothetical protein
VPLITPEQLIVYLDLPADTQPTDRAQLVCDLVADAVDEAAGATLAEPYAKGLKGLAMGAAARLYNNPLGLWSETVGSTSTVFPGSRTGGGGGILTPAEKEQITRLVGSAGPLYSFPEWDWSWTTIPAPALPD